MSLQKNPIIVINSKLYFMLHQAISNQFKTKVNLFHQVNFSSNYNHKLNCKSFSTVRLQNEEKYVIGHLFRISLVRKVTGQNVEFALARLVSSHNFYLKDATPAMSYLDANLNVKDFVNLIQGLYCKQKVNFNIKKLSFLVFQYLTPEEITSLKLLDN